MLAGPPPHRRPDSGAVVSAHRRFDPDQATQRAVQLRLGTVASVRPAAIGVAVTDGVVTLSGAVQTPAERARLLRAALQVPGVVVVGDDLRAIDDVDPEGRPSTTDVADRVSHVLQHQLRHWVVVRVSNGSAVIRGRFHSVRDRRRALLAVWSFRGVRSVDDRTGTEL